MIQTIVYNPNTKRPDVDSVEGSTIVIDNGLLDEKKKHDFGSTVMHESEHSIYHDFYYYNDYYQLL